MKAAALFKIFLKLKGEDAEDTGETVTLYAESYGVLTAAHAAASLLPEVRQDVTTGLTVWRGVLVPRDAFRGFRCDLVAQWMTEPQIEAAT